MSTNPLSYYCRNFLKLPFEGSVVDGLTVGEQRGLWGFTQPEDTAVTFHFKVTPQGVFFTMMPKAPPSLMCQLVEQAGGEIAQAAHWINEPVYLRVGENRCEYIVGDRTLTQTDKDRAVLACCGGLALGLTARSGIGVGHVHQALHEMGRLSELEQKLKDHLWNHMWKIARAGAWTELQDWETVIFPNFAAPEPENIPGPFSLMVPISGISPQNPFWRAQFRTYDIVIQRTIDRMRPPIAEAIEQHFARHPSWRIGRGTEQ